MLLSAWRGSERTVERSFQIREWSGDRHCKIRPAPTGSIAQIKFSGCLPSLLEGDQPIVTERTDDAVGWLPCALLLDLGVMALGIGWAFSMGIWHALILFK